MDKHDCSSCEFHTESLAPGIDWFCHCALDFVIEEHLMCCTTHDHEPTLTIRFNGRLKTLPMPKPTYNKFAQCIYWLKKQPALVISGDAAEAGCEGLFDENDPELLASIERGQKDIEEGRVYSEEEVFGTKSRDSDKIKELSLCYLSENQDCEHLGYKYGNWYCYKGDYCRFTEHDPSMHKICYTDRVCYTNMRDCQQCSE